MSTSTLTDIDTTTQQGPSPNRAGEPVTDVTVAARLLARAFAARGWVAERDDAAAAFSILHVWRGESDLLPTESILIAGGLAVRGYLWGSQLERWANLDGEPAEIAAAIIESLDS